MTDQDRALLLDRTTDSTPGSFSDHVSPEEPDAIPQATLLAQLIHFLQAELNISVEAIAIARRVEQLPNLLPMVLWQYGLVSLEQLEQIFDWLDTASIQQSL